MAKKHSLCNWELPFGKLLNLRRCRDAEISAPTPYRPTSKRLIVLESEARWYFSKLAIKQFTSDGRQVKAETLARSGHSSLKSATHQIWKSALRRHDDNEVKRFYRQSIERSENETNARLNTQRKIIKSLSSLWKNNQPYRPEKFLAPTAGDGVCTL